MGWRFSTWVSGWKVGLETPVSGDWGMGFSLCIVGVPLGESRQEIAISGRLAKEKRGVVVVMVVDYHGEGPGGFVHSVAPTRE